MSGRDARAWATRRRLGARRAARATRRAAFEAHLRTLRGLPRGGRRSCRSPPTRCRASARAVAPPPALKEPDHGASSRARPSCCDRRPGADRAAAAAAPRARLAGRRARAAAGARRCGVASARRAASARGGRAATRHGRPRSVAMPARRATLEVTATTRRLVAQRHAAPPTGHVYQVWLARAARRPSRPTRSSPSTQRRLGAPSTCPVARRRRHVMVTDEPQRRLAAADRQAPAHRND